MKKLLCSLLILLFSISFVLTACDINNLQNGEHVHTFGEWVVSKKPTCEETGRKVRYCNFKDCTTFEESKINKIPHIPVIDSATPPSCIQSGLTEGTRCSMCSTILTPQIEIPMVSHNYKDGLCIVCKKSKQLKNKEYSAILPTFYVYTNGTTIPDRSHPEYKNYAECNVSMFKGQTAEFEESAKIRIRGTSSRYFAKKGYKIKFSSAKSLEGLANSKKYNLLASYPDPCKLRDYLALSISYTMNRNSDRYAPLPILSKVYVDDKYQGLYFLLDDIEDGTGKIELDDYSNTDVQIPFVLEMDTIAYKEGVEGVNYFALGRTDVFDYDGDGFTDLLYVIDSDDNLTKAQFDYVENFVSSCRQSLVDGNLEKFSELVDVSSFIDYFLLGELFRNTDMAGRSVYMYKKSADSKLVFGPSWDFDYSCSRPYTLEPNVDYTLENAKDRFTNYDWWALFLEIPEAVNLIKERYTLYLRDIYLHEIKLATEFYSFYEQSIKEDAFIWYFNKVENINTLVNDNYNWTMNYFSLRLEMMDSLFLINI